MISYIFRRIAYLVPTLVIISIIIFFAMQLIPGDPVDYLLRGFGSEAQAEAMRERYGLDRHIISQFTSWFGGLMKGDLGYSIIYRRPASQVIFPRYLATLELAIAGLIMGLIIGIPLGVISGINQGSIADGLVIILSLLGVSVPVFVFGVLMQNYFSIQRSIFPTMGRVSVFENFIEGIRYLFMPAISVGFMIAAFTARNIRSEMLEVLKTDYIRTAKSKGLSRRVVYLKHALKNSMICTITVIGVMFALTLGGSVATELVFNWPGIGKLFVDASLAHDYHVIQGVVLLYAFSFVLVNFIIDLFYSFLDPRIEYN